MSDRMDAITAQELLEAVPDALIVSDASGEIVLVNTPAERLFGYARGELLGRKVELLMPERFRTVHLAHRDAYFQHTRRRPMGVGPELFGVRKDGTEFPVEITLSPLTTAHGTCAVTAIRDVSDRRRAEDTRVAAMRLRLDESSQVAREASALSERMSHLAYHDTLTALPNRLLLQDRLGRAMTFAHRYGKRLALLFVDVDHFKQVNDSLGHAMGDQLLRAVADRLTTCVRESDTVGRYSGDEFIVLLPDIVDHASAAVSAAKILAATTQPYHIAQHDIRITVSIGISVYPDDSEEPETLIDQADSAMYEAKARGRNIYQFFLRDRNELPGGDRPSDGVR